MGSEAKQEKLRVCMHCAEKFHTTAKALQIHARMCKQALEIKKRLEAAGLVSGVGVVVKK